VIVGKEDAISTADEMRSIAAAIKGSQFLEVASAGHMAPLESPGEVNAAIQRFLAAQVK
jgi:pimeloyl-ACP methyl ester carboxylesterase